MVVVDRYPSGYNFDETLTGDGVRDNTLSTVIPAPSGNAGTPAPPADPSLQAALDNTWPRSDVPGATVDAHSDAPGATVDAAMVRLREFVSESSKKLDSALHSFCQKQFDHDTRVDSILQDIRADRLDPDSFVTTQEFNHRVTPVLDTVAPLPAAVTALEASSTPFFPTSTPLFCRALLLLSCSWNWRWRARLVLP